MRDFAYVVLNSSVALICLYRLGCQNTQIWIQRIVPCFALPQSHTIFAYRGANAPLLCSYCCVSRCHTTTYVQEHVVDDLLTLESYTLRKEGNLPSFTLQNALYFINLHLMKYSWTLSTYSESLRRTR